MEVLKYEDKFLEAGCTAFDIADQNERAIRARKEIEDPEFQELAITGIEDEQQDTMTELVQLVEELPYEQLGRDYLASQERIRELREELERGLEEDNEAKLAIRALSSLVGEISPRARQKAEELADKRIKELDDANKEEIWQKIKEATAQDEQLARLYEDVGIAWELPMVYSKRPDELYLEDTIPVEPELRDKSENGFNEFAKRHIDQPKATQMIAYLFSRNVNKIVDALDIAKNIYSEDVCNNASDEVLRNRVTTLLGPKREDSPLSTMLESEGLALQYGWRKCFEWCGDKKKITRILRIYRVYRKGEKPEDIVQAEHPDHEIVWTIDGYLPQLEGEEQSDSVGIDQTEQEPMEEAPSGSDGQYETCRVKKIAIRKIEDLPPRLRRISKWGDFTIDVQKSIAELIERGVILQREQPVSLKAVRFKSGSRIMGTQESLRRMGQAGLISKNLTTKDSLQPEQVVIMHMFNSHASLLRNSKTQEIALKIIDRELNRTFGCGDISYSISI